VVFCSTRFAGVSKLSLVSSLLSGMTSIHVCFSICFILLVILNINMSCIDLHNLSNFDKNIREHCYQHR